MTDEKWLTDDELNAGISRQADRAIMISVASLLLSLLVLFLDFTLCFGGVGK